MRYAKVMGPSGPGYCAVEDRNGAWWASTAIAGPEEDPLAFMQGFQSAALDTLTLLVPVRPSKIVCVGRNYRDHAAELGNDVPSEPLIFLKPPSSLLAPGGVIEIPAISKRVDFEGELGIVIGRRCRNFQPGEDAGSYIRGYVLVNDVTARDLQKSDPQWTRGKGFDTFCPVGPVVSDEIDPIGGSVTVTSKLNGELRQQGSTTDFLFAIPELLRFVSSIMTLEPGDLIPTGTPAGVGAMQSGDTVEVAIDGLGVLRNRTAEAGTKA